MKKLDDYAAHLAERFHGDEAKATAHLRQLESKRQQPDFIGEFSASQRKAPTLQQIIERAANHEMILADNAEEDRAEAEASSPIAPREAARPAAKAEALKVGDTKLTGINRAIAARNAELQQSVK